MPKTKLSATNRPKKTTPSELIAIDTAKLAKAGKSQLTDFFDFVRQQGIVGLAIGLAVGTAAGAAVKEIVVGFINPIVGFIIGGIDLSQLTWVVIKPGASGRGGLTFSWGAILSSIITLLATAFVIYWIIHVSKLDRLDKKKDA